MTRSMSSGALAVAIVCLTTVVALAQQSTTSETKSFEVLAVEGNQLVVRLPEGTRELTVPEDFRFMVNGQPMSVRQLKPGMKGTATITTRTTVTPVTVTEVKNGTVMQSTGSSIIVRTDEGIKSFTQSDVDKRGIKIMRNGQPATVTDFRQGDRLSATIITSKPPQVLTEKEVQATTSAAATGGAPAASAPRAASATRPSSSSSASSSTAASNAASGTPSQAPTAGARTLPKTASSWPLLWLVSVLSLAIGVALTMRRRFVR
jgi:hypothetical protein